MKLLHLARRFVRALWPGPPRETDVAWVGSILTPAELSLWRRLPNHDRRYSIRVARNVERALAGTGYDDPRWQAVALLHDVGKLDTGLGVASRALATVAGAVRPSARQSDGRVGRYLRHDELGEAMLRAAGGREEAAAWAGAHHRRERWEDSGLPGPVAEALAAADDA
ncbi:MAG: HD domain-containing protein [Acidimicrobiia bacterium]